MFSAEGRDQPSCAADLYSKLCSFSAAFLDVLVCVQFALTLPIASATAERSFFSVMRCIKSHLRASMSDTRLISLALIAVEQANKASHKLMIDREL